MVAFIRDLKSNRKKLKEYSDNSLMASLVFTYKNAESYVL